MIYERILAEKERLDKELKAIQNQLTFLPPGKLICTRNANRYKWYNSDGRKQTYSGRNGSKENKCGRYR